MRQWHSALDASISHSHLIFFLVFLFCSLLDSHVLPIFSIFFLYAFLSFLSLVFLFLSQTEYARMEGGKYVYRIHRSPMCEYMINFIHKLKHLPEKYMMNSVLENFTILQVPHFWLFFFFMFTRIKIFL